MSERPPRVAMALGYAGLLPQLACVAVIMLGPPLWHYSALSLAFAYPAVILSFLGGMWWGLASNRGEGTPTWVWIAAVVPSLLSVASALPWAIGAAWPGPSLVFLGQSLLISLVVDRRLVVQELAPGWWMRLRVPLSVGLGGLTILAGVFG